MNVQEEFEHNGFRVRIIQDDDSTTPEDGDGWPVYLAHFHRDFEHCPEGVPFGNKEECEEFLKEYRGPPNPRDWNGDCGDEGDFETKEDHEDDCEYNREDNDAAWELYDELHAQWEVFLVTAHIHGGIVLHLSNRADEGVPRATDFDTSCCGAVLIKKEGWGSSMDDEGYNYESAGKTHKTTWCDLAESHVKVWNQYLSGDVWEYEITKAVKCDKCGNVEYEVIDSCCGFYGLDDCIKEAKESAEYEPDND